MDDPTPRPRSPLAELLLTVQAAVPDAAAQVHVQPSPFVGQVAVRGKPEDAKFLSAAGGVLGLDLPLAVAGVVETNACRAIWLGPDHWLLIVSEGEAPAMVQSLQAAFTGLFAAAIDVCGARIRLRLAGPAALDVLASGCRLDLDPAVLKSGHAVQTPVGNVTAILHRLSQPADAYDLYIPRSQALSFWRWLEHAARPYGLSVTA